MAYTTSPTAFAPHGESWTARGAAALGRVVDFIGVLVAAGRVARAVEARQEPALADLQTLGINGPLPRVW